MAHDIEREDLRKRKTRAALTDAMLALLERRKFSKITVSDLCGKALVSRSAFYTHFTDKYDLLRDWLTRFRDGFLRMPDGEPTERAVGAFLGKYETVFMNLVKDSDGELQALLADFMTSVLALSSEERQSGQISLRHSVVSRFCAGGLTHFILWKMTNKAIPEARMREAEGYLRETLRRVTRDSGVN
ncbi:MAG: TetR/AcrR family transcriptional regulator [Clostridiales bacterium]|jgi:AcrR family transcriptional regulator|nr:TetR/AcrR family transcriptional regulator [Clostridiales bacterium]